MAVTMRARPPQKLVHSPGPVLVAAMLLGDATIADALGDGRLPGNEELEGALQRLDAEMTAGVAELESKLDAAQAKVETASHRLGLAQVAAERATTPADRAAAKAEIESAEEACRVGRDEAATLRQR
jgi:hypothetical protein